MDGFGCGLAGDEGIPFEGGRGENDGGGLYQRRGAIGVR